LAGIVIEIMKKIILSVILLFFFNSAYADNTKIWNQQTGSESILYQLENEVKSSVIADFIDNVWVCPDGYYQLSGKPHVCCKDGYIERSDGACCVLSDEDDCYCPAGKDLVEPFICCPEGPPNYIASQDKKKCVLEECPPNCTPTQFEGRYCGATHHLDFENQTFCCDVGYYAPDPNLNICCRNGTVLKEGEQYCVYSQGETMNYGEPTLGLSCCVRDTDKKRSPTDCARLIPCRPCCPKGQEWNFLELKCGPIVPMELQVK